MQYITVPVTSKEALIEFLTEELTASFEALAASPLTDDAIEYHSRLLYASQQALKQYGEFEKCPG
jgi:hypothetical protein